MTAYYFERFGERPGGQSGGGGRSLRRLFGPSSDGKPMRALLGLFQPSTARGQMPGAQPVPERRSFRTIPDRMQEPEIDCTGGT